MSLRGLKQHFRRIAVLAVSAAMVLSAAPSKALAYVRPDIQREASLEIYCHKGNVAFANVNFKAYRVADMNDLVRFSFSGNFEPYKDSVAVKDQMTNADWVSMADVLTGFAQRDNIPADYTSATDETGHLKWQGMATGLYLVVGESFERETLLDGYHTKIYYKPAPFVIALPSLVDDEWQYDVAVSPKSVPSSEGETSRRLLKVWDDSGHEASRPEKLTFDLLRNGEVYETVELSAENNWRYQWDGLDNKDTWRIVEKAIDGYTVSAATEGITYVVTNKYNSGPGSDPGTEPGSNNPYRPGGHHTGSSGGGGSSSGGPGATPPVNISDGATPLAEAPGAPGILISEDGVPLASWPKLPQTGQLWWPVPILGGAGMITFFAGWLLRRKEHEN